MHPLRAQGGELETARRGSRVEEGSRRVEEGGGDEQAEQAEQQRERGSAQGKGDCLALQSEHLLPSSPGSAYSPTLPKRPSCPSKSLKAPEPMCIRLSGPVHLRTCVQLHMAAYGAYVCAAELISSA